MAIEIYIKDCLTVYDRMAVEAKRYKAGMPLPEDLTKDGLEKTIGDFLEPRIEKANGYSSRREMFSALDSMRITYFPNPSSFDYQFKILAHEHDVDAVKKVVSEAGYRIVDLPDSYVHN